MTVTTDRDVEEFFRAEVLPGEATTKPAQPLKGNHQKCQSSMHHIMTLTTHRDVEDFSRAEVFP